MTAQVVLVLRKAADFEPLLKRLDTIAQPHDDVALLLHCETEVAGDPQLQMSLDADALLKVCGNEPHVGHFCAADVGAIVAALRQRCTAVSVCASSGKLAAVVDDYARRSATLPLICLALEKTLMVSR